MKVISKFIFLVCVAAFFFGCEKEESILSVDNNFVRFGLMVDANGMILEFPTVKANVPETSMYTHNSTKTIKIPVVLTSTLKSVPTDIFYEMATEGGFSGFEINYPNKITIPAGKLIDTLRISFNSRWQEANVNKIKLKITATSDASIGIGFKNANNKLDKLQITLGDLATTKYYFQQNLYNIGGTLNEELLIPIRFSQPITNQMIGNFNFIDPQFTSLSICDGLGANFDYSLEKMPFADGVTQIFYKLKVLSVNPFASNLKLTLNQGLLNFEVAGTSQTNIVKAANAVRQGDVANKWYNVADSFYRTFGKAWYYDPVTAQCKWSTFNTFTKPVPVPPGSEFDNGQGYHKYKIGFVSNSPPVGTNPFDFRRYYENANVTSPAFNIVQALEFFPENGNSITNGSVKVTSQTLSFIKAANNQTVQVPICGSGNYYYNSVFARWEMYLEIHCDETAINGNNDVVRKMYIYSNNNNSANPANLTTACSSRVIF